MRCVPELEACIDGACQLARRFGHRAVRPEHVLCVLEQRDGIRWADYGIERALLREELRAALGGADAASGYRDVRAEIVPSDRLASALERARSRRRLGFVTRPVRPEDLLGALVEDAEVARLISRARGRLESGDAVIVAARVLATGHGHKHVTIAHVLAVLVNEPPLIAALSHIPGARERLAGALDAELVPAPRQVSLRRPDVPLLAPNLVRVVAVTEALRAAAGREKVVSPRRLLTAILREPDVGSRLAAVGINRWEVLYAVHHGGPPSEAPAPGAAPQKAVVFYNDDDTTMELVLDVLTRFFELKDVEAKRSMLEAHREGSARVAVLPVAEAEARAGAALAFARENGAPLRIDLEDVWLE
jgi:ATP-dependent Clp protease adaptor protein ClpS